MIVETFLWNNARTFLSHYLLISRDSLINRIFSPFKFKHSLLHPPLHYL